MKIIHTHWHTQKASLNVSRLFDWFTVIDEPTDLSNDYLKYKYRYWLPVFSSNFWFNGWKKFVSDSKFTVISKIIYASIISIQSIKVYYSHSKQFNNDTVYQNNIIRHNNKIRSPEENLQPTRKPVPGFYILSLLWDRNNQKEVLAQIRFD